MRNSAYKSRSPRWGKKPRLGSEERINSTTWQNKQVTEHGLRSRSRCVIDFCAAPGEWLQVASKFMPISSIIVGVDLVPIKPIKNVITFQEDITSGRCKQASRNESVEIFVVCQSYIALHIMDSKMLDPKYVFKEVQPENQKKPTLLNKKQKKRAEGEGDYTLFKTANISELIKSDSPLELLTEVNLRRRLHLPRDNSVLSRVLHVEQAKAECLKCRVPVSVFVPTYYNNRLWRKLILDTLKPAFISVVNSNSEVVYIAKFSNMIGIKFQCWLDDNREWDITAEGCWKLKVIVGNLTSTPYIVTAYPI